ncbi:MAG: cadmium-translocating P-type ATPase [Clostridia bacterium]|nr:cadmium-translocating P-type ATPase [Clostridia bacterium]
MDKIRKILDRAAQLFRGNKLTASQKGTLYKVAASTLLLIAALFLGRVWIAKLIVCIIAYVICAYDVILAAIKRARRGNIFEEHMLMSVASIGAFILGEYTEGCAVMILYQLGELFQSIAVGRSRRSIRAMMELRPERAHKLVAGEVVDVDTSELVTGDVCVVRPGERIPVDGVIVDGVLEADASAITGESLPLTVHPGGAVISGYINLTHIVRVKATSDDADSTVTRILKIVEEQSQNKSENEKLVTKFAKYYTPAIFALTLIVAIVPGIITKDFATWVYRALSLLVISCPCAFVISVPLTYFSGIGGASSRGILIKGGSVIDMLAKCDTLMLDKTGTLTTGKLHITSVHPSGGANESVLLTVASVSEGGSNHPIAKAVYEYTKNAGIKERKCEKYTEIPGRGTAVLADGHMFFAGEADFIRSLGIEVDEREDASEKRVYFAFDKRYVGYIAMSDRVKVGADSAIRAARAAGIKRIGMFSGDRRAIAERVAGELGLDICESELKPEDKLTLVRGLKENGATVLFAGDGINDAPTLSEASVGIAMGDIGSDAALEAADAVIMDGRLDKLADAVNVSKYTVGIVKQNIALTTGIKFLVLVLTLIGKVNMTAAIFADVGVALIAIINAMRALDPKLD